MFGTYVSTKELMTFFFLVNILISIFTLIAIMFLAVRQGRNTVEIRNFADKNEATSISGDDNNAS